MFGPFRKVWAVDFEYLQSDWEISDPICLVAWELQGGQKIRLWENQLGERPPYSIDAESLFVSFAADAELRCHLALNWPMPLRVLDLRAEFKRVTNTTPVDPRYKDASLLQTLTYYGLDGINSDQKTYWRDLILRGRPWTQEEQEGILTYCETDVAALARLLPAMGRRSHIDLPRALLRGRYMIATTKMQATGVPIDQVRQGPIEGARSDPVSSSRTC